MGSGGVQGDQGLGKASKSAFLAGRFPGALLLARALPAPPERALMQQDRQPAERYSGGRGHDEGEKP